MEVVGAVPVDLEALTLVVRVAAELEPVRHADVRDAADRREDAPAAGDAPGQEGRSVLRGVPAPSAAVLAAVFVVRVIATPLTEMLDVADATVRLFAGAPAGNRGVVP